MDSCLFADSYNCFASEKLARRFADSGLRSVPGDFLERAVYGLRSDSDDSESESSGLPSRNSKKPRNLCRPRFTTSKLTLLSVSTISVGGFVRQLGFQL